MNMRACLLVIYIPCKVQIQEGKQANLEINIYILEFVWWDQGYYEIALSQKLKEKNGHCR